MSARREFSKAVKVQIIQRATTNGVVYCENCRNPTRRFDIDHTIPDGLVIDKSKRLTAVDGKLLCSGSRHSCHGVKSAEQDVPAIARAVRIEAKELRADKPKGSIPSKPKAPRTERALAHGSPEIARRFASKT